MLKHLLRESSQIPLDFVRQLAQVPGVAKACNVRSCSTSSSSTCLPLTTPVYMIWGANTDVGKTLVSAGLAAATKRSNRLLTFIKPVQTGFPKDSDARLVALASGATPSLGAHAARLDGLHSADTSEAGSYDTARTLFAWTDPVSPSVAAQTEGHAVTDAQLHTAVLAGLNDAADLCHQHNLPGITFVETAGGPASPAPSGSLQCDCWRHLRLPAILVGDARLGGISTSVTAYETLRSRGYDVPIIVLAAGSHARPNRDAIQANVRAETDVVLLPHPLPALPASKNRTALDGALQEWLQNCAAAFDALLAQLVSQHQQRMILLGEAQSAAKKNFWWPFTQHSTVLQDSVTVIDSRCGESFAVYQPGNKSDAAAQLQMQYDACASWWTQGISAELQPRLVSSMAYAAGRYGHVIFPENTHQPALHLAQKLLDGVGQGWAGKVFFSDNGSTAIEVAIKMAMRKYKHDRPGIIFARSPSDAGTRTHTQAACDSHAELHVIGLTNGYHGDTLGAMDAVAETPYNNDDQTPWFRSRGLFLQPPTVGLTQGQWQVSIPSKMWDYLKQHAGSQMDDGQLTFPRREGVFGQRQDAQDAYAAYIASHWQQYEAGRAVRIAACIMEPVLQGAGGMVMIDPAFQRAMAQHCQEHNIPVILDEVFSGIWRLGHLSAADMLGIKPDIACYAKLLTGGMLPLSATLATNSIFEAFQHDSKLKALLHGHSYTAHAIGCSAAVTALDLYTDPACNPNLREPDQQTASPSLVELWDEQIVDQLSRHARVQKLTVLGTVFAAELKTEGVSGYGATEAIQVAKDLRLRGIYARPLGNVVYLMVTPTTAQETCKRLLQELHSVL